MPIHASLRKVLLQAGEAAGIDTVRVTSGGQPPHPRGPRTGSTRHDNGMAADLVLIVNGVTLTFTDQNAHPQVLAFVTEAARAGAIGIGAGVTYMGPSTMHVGFGTDPSDRRQLTWGANGSSATAPAWLRKAAQAGWADEPRTPIPVPPPAVQGEAYLVSAPSGLRLRAGPDTSSAIIRSVPNNTPVQVLERWARTPDGWMSLDHLTKVT
jgi:hypothetical protein